MTYMVIVGPAPTAKSAVAGASEELFAPLHHGPRLYNFSVLMVLRGIEASDLKKTSRKGTEREAAFTRPEEAHSHKATRSAYTGVKFAAFRPDAGARSGHGLLSPETQCPGNYGSAMAGAARSVSDQHGSH